jgi:hypothetical protein
LGVYDEIYDIGDDVEWMCEWMGGRDSCWADAVEGGRVEGGYD